MSRAMSIKVGWCFITSPTCFVLKAVCSEPVLYYFSAMLGKNAIGLPCPAIHANFSLRSKEVGNRFVPFRTQEAMVFFFMPVVPSSSVFAKQVRTISHPNIKCLESWISPLVLLRLLKTLCAFWCSVFFSESQDQEKFKEIGNAFQVKGELLNAMTLALLCPSCWLVISCHASCKCAWLSRRRHLVMGHRQFAEVDDLKEAICSEVALSQVCFGCSCWDSTAVCFRQSKRRRSYPLPRPRLTSTARRRAFPVSMTLTMSQLIVALFFCSWQDGKWIKEEKMSASLRDTDEPITWCFVLSSL